MADVDNGLVAGSLTDFEMLDSLAYFDDYASSFMSSALGTKLSPGSVSIDRLLSSMARCFVKSYIGGRFQSSIMK